MNETQRITDSRLSEMILWEASGLMNHGQDSPARQLSAERFSALTELAELRERMKQMAGEHAAMKERLIEIEEIWPNMTWRSCGDPIYSKKDMPHALEG